MGDEGEEALEVCSCFRRLASSATCSFLGAEVDEFAVVQPERQRCSLAREDQLCDRDCRRAIEADAAAEPGTTAPVEAVVSVTVLDQPSSDDEGLLRSPEYSDRARRVRAQRTTGHRRRAFSDVYSPPWGDGSPEHQLGNVALIVDAEGATAERGLGGAEDRASPVRVDSCLRD